MPVKSKVKVSQNFVAFSEYMNFTSGWFVFVCFLEEIEDTKKTFQNQLTFNNLAIMERIHIGSFVIKYISAYLI